MTTPTETLAKALCAIRSAMNVDDCGINGMSMRGQTLFPHLYTLLTALEQTGKWRPIETAPRDGTWFLGLIDGIPYQVSAFMNGNVVNYLWKMHTNVAEGQILRIDGDKKIQIKEEDAPKYEPRTLAYKSGMNHYPTHWMHLPAPPTEGDKG